LRNAPALRNAPTISGSSVVRVSGLALRGVAILILGLPAVLPAQSILQISPQQCVWHAGDDADGILGWARPSLDEAGWSPYVSWKLNPLEPRIWVRCHVDVATIRQAAHPAVQSSLRAAYQLFVDGRFTGAFGDMRSGDFTGNYVRTFPLGMTVAADGRSTIALRILMRSPPRRYFNLVGIRNDANDAELTVGEQGWLENRRDSLALAQGLRTMPVTIAFGIVGVTGFMLFGLYLSDRSRLAFLFLALHCWALAMRRMLEQLEASLYPISVAQYQLLDGLLLTLFPTLVLFGYALARKPVPWFYRIAIGLLLTLALEEAGRSFLPASMNLRLSPAGNFIVLIINLLWVLLYLSPFTAFWPWRRISGSMRYAALALMAWSVVNEIYIALLLSRNLSLPFADSFDAAWFPFILEVRALLTLAAVVVLLVILFGDQRKTAKERAQFAGELESAREVQQQLIPVALPMVAGLQFEAAYLPARDVGGDFYQIIPLLDGATLVLIGDVSGKGLKAAMKGVLALGAMRALAAEGCSPAQLLSRLNQEMLRAPDSGFITCLCLRIALDGKIILANAGHLAPYRNGIELPSECSLPLGLVPNLEYEETTIQSKSGDQLTLMTDGVVEATHLTTGELFGFDRTAAISTQSAEQIAAAAQAFGQEDDITVLTLTFAPALKPAEVQLA